jgi:hypothetical protein
MTAKRSYEGERESARIGRQRELCEGRESVCENDKVGYGLCETVRVEENYLHK